MATATDQRMALALRKLEKDGNALGLIDERLRAFNVFEILRVHRKELQHTNFLGYLLDPRSPHGLGVAFLREFLRNVVKNASQLETPISDKEVERLDLASCTVVREFEHNDLRITNSSATFVAVVENKIDDTERDGQLAGYRLRVEQRYPSARRVFVYLTPGGDLPSDTKWISFSYAELVKILSRLVAKRRPRLDDSHRIVIEQYLQAVRKHVLEKSDLVEKARKLYRAHRPALDYIFENRTSYADSLHTELAEVIAKDTTLRLDSESDTYFRFIPKSWDRLDQLKTKVAWNDGSLITVEVSTPPPGPSSKVGIHVALHLDSSPRVARALYKAIQGKSFKNGSGFRWLFRKSIVATPIQEDKNLNRRVTAELSSFIAQELPKITNQIRRTLRE